MSKYIYYWDRNNKKKVYGGKYSKVNPDARGYYSENDAGDPHELGKGGSPDKREFIGSGQKEYTFYSETKGILTVKADSFEEAWRQAKARGYSRKQYKR